MKEKVKTISKTLLYLGITISSIGIALWYYILVIKALLKYLNS